jgi:hypothetical protein
MNEHYALVERDVRPIKLVYPRHFFIEVPVPSQESRRLYIVVLGVSIVALSTILIFELFRQCGIFYFFI